MPAVLVAVLAVLVVGGIAFAVVKSGSSDDSTTASSGATQTSGPAGSATTGGALEKQLAALTPTTDDLNVLVKPMFGVTEADVPHWTLHDELYATSDQTRSQCAPDAPLAEGAYGRQWGLMDRSGRSYRSSRGCSSCR